MFFREIAEAVAHKPKAAVRRKIDKKVNLHVGNFQLDWKESNEGRLKFKDNANGNEVVVIARWTLPNIEVHSRDDPAFYKSVFKKVAKEKL